MDTEILRSVENKKFSEFSDAVKQEMRAKLANNPEVKQYVSDYDKLQKMNLSAIDAVKTFFTFLFVFQ